jgi:hypothetical protein
MRSRGGMLVVAKMDKVNSANIQTMIDKHADANATLLDIPLRAVTTKYIP